MPISKFEKSNYMKNLFLSVLLLCSIQLLSNSPGDWTAHFSYFSPQRMVQADNKIYCATTNAIFSYDLEEYSIATINKLNRLSNVNISALDYLPNANAVAVGYENGAIDILGVTSDYSISDIKNKVLYGSKAINKIIEKDDLLYIASDAGIIVYNYARKEVKESYIISKDAVTLEVKNVFFLNDSIFAHTQQGIYAALQSLSIVQPDSWNKVNELNDIYSMVQIDSVFYVSRKVDSVYKVSPMNDTTYVYYEGESPCKLKVIDRNLFQITPHECKVYRGGKFLLKNIDESFNFRVINDALLINDEMWLSYSGGGLVRETDGSPIIPMGPNDDYTNEVEVLNGKLYFANGRINSYDFGWVNTFDGRWGNYQSWDMKDFSTLAVDSKGNYYCGSYVDGLGLFDNKFNFVSLFDTVNSPVTNLVFNAKVDRKNVLWVGSSNSEASLAAYDSESWQTFPFSTLGGVTVKDIYADLQNQLWLSIYFNSAANIIVYDYGKTISDTSDDSFVSMSLVDQDGDVFGNQVNCFVQDKDGDMWIGTNNGPAVYSNPDRVQSASSHYFSRIKIDSEDSEEEDGVNRLLDGRNITAIAVDAANRKWIGTEGSGVYLVSENGQEQIYNFNEDNYLPSNYIKAIGIFEQTGEVFFATDKGIVTFHGDATAPVDEYTELEIYPNPVRPGYHGNIYIKGLVDNTTVTITDMSGNLVKQMDAFGGQAVWDGTNLFGKRVQTGAYLVFCSDPEGLKTFTDKVFFIN